MCYNNDMDKFPLYDNAVSVVIKEKTPVVEIVPRCDKFLVFNNVEIPIEGDTLEMLEEFGDCDGFASSMLFDKHMGDTLIKAGLAVQTTREIGRAHV